MMKRIWYFTLYFIIAISMANWIMMFILNIPLRNGYQDSAHHYKALGTYIFLVAIWVVPFVLIIRKLKQDLWAAFKMRHFSDPMVKRLNSISVGDKLQFDLNSRPFVENSKIYTVTEKFSHVCMRSNSILRGNKSDGYELTAAADDEKIFFTFSDDGRVKFSKKIDLNEFLDLISPYTEQELLEAIKNKKFFRTKKDFPVNIKNWISSGKYLSKNRKIRYLKKCLNNSYYVFISGFTHVLSEQYRIGKGNSYLPHFEETFEISFKDQKISDVLVAYSIDALAYKDHIHINPTCLDGQSMLS